ARATSDAQVFPRSRGVESWQQPWPDGAAGCACGRTPFPHYGQSGADFGRPATRIERTTSSEGTARKMLRDSAVPHCRGGRRHGLARPWCPAERRINMNDPLIQSEATVVEPHHVDTVTLPSTCPPLAVRSFGLTDRGKVRTSNQDQFLIAGLVKALQIEQTSLPGSKVQHSRARRHVFVVADGMGGHAAGE